MLFVLNLGAVVGLVIAGWLADRHGTKPIVLMWFVLAAVFLAVLSIPMASQVVLNLVVFITGVFVFSAQVLVYAFVSAIYPATARGTALGMASAVGRIGAIVGPFITGTLVAAGIATRGASTSSRSSPSSASPRWRSCRRRCRSPRLLWHHDAMDRCRVRPRWHEQRTVLPGRGFSARE